MASVLKTNIQILSQNHFLCQIKWFMLILFVFISDMKFNMWTVLASTLRSSVNLMRVTPQSFMHTFLVQSNSANVVQNGWARNAPQWWSGSFCSPVKLQKQRGRRWVVNVFVYFTIARLTVNQFPSCDFWSHFRFSCTNWYWVLLSKAMTLTARVPAEQDSGFFALATPV